MVITVSFLYDENSALAKTKHKLTARIIIPIFFLIIAPPL